MKIIFLDVDGVLSCFGARGLCATRLDLFADIVKKTGAKVVLSSTWRYPHCREQRMRLMQELGKREVELFGMTPMLEATDDQRGREIDQWVRSVNRRLNLKFVILDDDPNNEITGNLRAHLVKCDGYQGLTAELATEVIRKLNTPQL